MENIFSGLLKELFDSLTKAQVMGLLKFGYSSSPNPHNTTVFNIKFPPQTGNDVKNNLFSHIKDTYAPHNAYFLPDKSELNVIFTGLE